MTNKNYKKKDKATRVGQLLAGTRKRFTNAGQTLTIEGAPVTVDALEKELQGFLDDHAAVAAAKATVKAKVAAENARLVALNTLVKGFIAFLRVTFGNDPEALADFGLAPRKAPAPMTAEQKAVAAEKRKATRAARGTKTAKQKKAIHGNVTIQMVVTPAEPTEATATTPAATAAATPPKG